MMILLTDPMPPYLAQHKCDLTIAIEMCHRSRTFALAGDQQQAGACRDLMDKIYQRLENDYPKWKVNYERQNLRHPRLHP